jgi:hypothetical protein
LKKNFISVGLAATSWTLQALASGFLYALAAFLTKESLDRLRSKIVSRD